MHMQSAGSDNNHLRSESVLITANFSNTIGFAWKFFFRLFNVLARSLQEKGISICLSFAQIEGPVTILDRDIPFHSFVFDPLNISLRGLLQLRKQIRDKNIRYVYLTDYGSWHWLYLLLRLWGVRKIVAHSHISVPDPNPPSPTKGLKKIFKNAIHKTRFLSADSVYACSRFVKDRYVKKNCCPQNRIKVITHGIDIDRFNCNQKSDASSQVRVFCVARATRYKGIHILIEATRLLRDKYTLDNYIVQYGGTGPHIEEFRQLLRDKELDNKFSFLGELDDTRKMTCAADIIVVPSIWGDAYPLSVMEAMAAGKALIATDVGGIPEQVGNDGAAILVPHSDSESLAAALADLIRDEHKRKDLGIKARKRAEKLFKESVFHQKVVSNLISDFELHY